MASRPAQERPRDPALSGQWRVVPERSALAFETRIIFGLVPVRGRYAGYKGTLTVGAEGDATGTLTIESATVSTGIKRRDRHLASTDFFAVERFSQLRFELATLVAGEPGTARLTGTLTIRDRAQAIDGPVRMTLVGGEGLRIDADLEVDHRSVGFEFKRLPKKVHAKASLTLQRAS